MSRSLCTALPQAPPHPATHERLQLCDQHFTEYQRAVLAYRKADQRHRDGQGPDPGERKAYVQGKFTPAVAPYRLFPESALASLRYDATELSAAAYALGKINNEEAVFDVPAGDLVTMIERMVSAAKNLTNDVDPLLRG